jgi:tRNA(Ile)-lysidine synthase
MRRVDPERLVEHVRAGGLLPAGRPVVALLSGGRDSVCLLDVAVRVGAEVSALHVNYGLRDGADGDEAHCAELCARMGVSLETVRPGPPSGNVQAWARDVRYAAAARGGVAVAAGHTATDQAETVLQRLASSPGRRALLGMRPREGCVVRPLLDYTREDTAAYCRARGLEWREDPTNRGSLFTRARVRGQLLPALRAIHPAAEANVVRTAALLRDEAEVLDAVVDGVLEGTDRIELARLAALPAALRRLVARRLAGDAPAAATRVEEILALAPAGGSASLDLGAGLRAVVEYGVLRFATGPPPASPEPVHLPIPGDARFGDWSVTAERSGEGSRDAGGLSGEAVYDASRLGESLIVRAWRAGDRVGSRSLGDLFTDRRVPREARRTIPVVESGGRIAWVPGVATGAEFAATASTRSAVRLSARPPR